MLAVYLPETGVSRHSRPFLILTDEFKPQPAASEGGRDRGEREKKERREVVGYEKETDGYRKRGLGAKVSARKKRTEVGEREETDKKGEEWRRNERALSFTCQSVLARMSQSSLLLEA